MENKHEKQDNSVTRDLPPTGSEAKNRLNVHVLSGQSILPPISPDNAEILYPKGEMAERGET